MPAERDRWWHSTTLDRGYARLRYTPPWQASAPPDNARFWPTDPWSKGPPGLQNANTIPPPGDNPPGLYRSPRSRTAVGAADPRSDSAATAPRRTESHPGYGRWSANQTAPAAPRRDPPAHRRRIES